VSTSARLTPETPAVAYLDDRAVRFNDWGQALTALGVTPRLLDCGTCYEE